ncbi:hypothetical protein BH10PLA1_BH10PLA1_21250 [soil metagenome]
MRCFQWLCRSFGLLCLGTILMVTAGCSVPAQLVWSPDGSAAAYRLNDKAFVIDAAGKIAAELGDSTGGYAWSGDSKTLYYATPLKTADVATPVDVRWQQPLPSIHFEGEENKVPESAYPTKNPPAFVELQTFAGGKSTSLLKFAAGKPLHMALSPDQQWLALVCETAVNDTYAVYAYHLPAKKLYLISDFAGLAMCYTGPSRLAYVEPDRLGDKADAMTGRVVEIMLDAAQKELVRVPLMDVVPSQTPWIVAIGDNLLLTSIARTFPGKPVVDDKLICKLFLWTRANCGIVSLADDVGPLFALSPDGQRILIEKITPAMESSPAKRELLLIRANGSDGMALRDLSHRDIFALWPAWHGNGEITFTSPEEDAKTVTVKNETRLQYDIVQYKITDKGELQAIKTLSEGWDAAMKPYIPVQTSVSTTRAASQPATLPTTQP